MHEVLPLHSTMSLLKQAVPPINVSQPLSLHSTMSLLKPKKSKEQKRAGTNFTFHYVSIKTVPLKPPKFAVTSLHSTMSLLKRILDHLFIDLCPFTFHYVSIKTVFKILLTILFMCFTFHYVSIKTGGT